MRACEARRSPLACPQPTKREGGRPMRGCTSQTSTRLALAVSLVFTARTPVEAQELADTPPASLLSADHYVRVISKAPSMEGETALIYLRERVLPMTAVRSRLAD